jgi:branched-chain amino acid transport system substrate-binding protein
MQNTKRFWVLAGIVVAVILVLVVSTYYSKENIIDVIKVGVIAPLSGNQAFIGQDFKEGLELKSPKNMSLIFEDSQGDVTKAVSAYNKLKLDKIDVLIVVGAGDEALIPLVDKDMIPTILTVSSTGGLPTKSKYVFRYFTNADGDVPVMVKYIKDNLVDVKTVGIIHIQDNYGISYKDAFVKQTEANGIKISGVEQYFYTDFDYKTQLTKLNQTKPDAIYIIGLDYQVTQIMKQAKQLGIKTKFISIGTIATSYAISQANGVLEGIYTTAFCTDGSPVNFQEVFKAKYNKAGGFFAEMGDDIISFIETSSKSQRAVFSADKFVAELTSLKNYRANTGLVSSTKEGELTIEVCPKTIKDSKIFNFTSGKFSSY